MSELKLEDLDKDIITGEVEDSESLKFIMLSLQIITRRLTEIDEAFKFLTKLNKE